MKKLFLIPLMTLVCSVMAWGADVAETGGVKYSSLQAAINAAEPGATVTLLTNTSGALTLSKDVTLAGGYQNTGDITINADITLTLAGVTLKGGSGDIVTMQNHNLNVVAADGTTNVIKTTAYADAFFGQSGGEETLRISGNGTLYIMSWEVFSVHYLYVEAPNLIVAAHPGRTIYNGGYKGGELTGGAYSDDPSNFNIAEGYLLSKPNLSEDAILADHKLNGHSESCEGYTYYKVIAQGNTKVLNHTQSMAYETNLSDAVAEANNGDYLILYANDASNVSVGTNIEISKNGYTANVSASSGYSKYENSNRILISNNDLVAYLHGNSSDTYIISTEDLTSAGGQVIVNGIKTVSIPENITLNCAYQGAGYSIVVPNGAKLTLVGKGTIASDRSILLVEDGGELVVGSSENDDVLTFTTSYNAAMNEILVNKGTATLYNAHMLAKSAAIHNYGMMDIIGGLYTGEASTANSHKYCITADTGSQLKMKGVTVKGVHGAVCCQSLDPQHKGGVARIENCDLQATNQPNGTPVGGTVHYGLYTATTAIVSVYNTKISSTYQNNACHIGNNDAFSTFGLIYLYEGCMVKANSLAYKLFVQKRKTTDSQVLFPVSIDQNSDWYKAAVNGGEGPLPAGYVWKEIINAGEPSEDQVLDAAAYADGYRWKVVSDATKESEATGTTIPWQQNTTWTDTETPKVPDQNTAVSIPEGKIVVVDKDQANKNAEAEQIFIGGEGASLTIQDGTTLNVENGVNIADGGNLVVNAGAMVTIGAGGLVTASDDAVKIEMTEGQSGIFMIAPTVTENTHPMAKVELVSKAYKRGENDFVYQRFGIPAYMEGVKRSDMQYDHVAAPTAVWKLDYINRTWADMDDNDEFIPFRCYELTTTAVTPGAVYTFTCPLMGNGNAELELNGEWNYYANSYTAPIDVKELLASFVANYSEHMSATVYLYRASDDWWYELNEMAYLFDKTHTLPTKIDPMQAFIFQKRGEGANPQVNYKDNVWDPIMNPSAGAPTRNNSSFNKAMIEITAANGTKDAVRLVENNNFSAAFDNSFDAAKYMNEKSFNLFVDANNEKLGSVATDNLNGTVISMTTKEQTAFTMTISNVNNMNYVVRDMLTGTEIEMVEGASYMFSVPANTNVEGRFMIVAKAQAPTSIETIAADAATKGIYTLTGQFVGNDYYNLPNGVYVVDGKKVVK